MSKKVELLFSEVLGVSADTMNDTTSPDNTPQWDSVQAINLVLALEQEFQVKFTTKEIVGMRTIALVKKTLRAKAVEDV